jgi:hypothetical protein
MALISSIYKRGDESAAHYKRQRNDRSRNWANDLKNAAAANRERKVTRVNIHTHAYESVHGYAPILTSLEDFV